MARLLCELNIVTICEGVETAGELAALQDLGVSLIQGYVLARPTFEALAMPTPVAQILMAAA